jgi:hypothetical protein
MEGEKPRRTFHNGSLAEGRAGWLVGAQTLSLRTVTLIQVSGRKDEGAWFITAGTRRYLKHL